MRDYTGNDNYGKPKSEYINGIGLMTDEGLLKETEDKIWLSAYANNNPRSDYHWHTEVIYEEWIKRNKVDQYIVAYKNVTKGL